MQTTQAANTTTSNEALNSENESQSSLTTPTAINSDARTVQSAPVPLLASNPSPSTSMEQDFTLLLMCTAKLKKCLNLQG